MWEYIDIAITVVRVVLSIQFFVMAIVNWNDDKMFWIYIGISMGITTGIAT